MQIFKSLFYKEARTSGFSTETSSTTTFRKLHHRNFDLFITYWNSQVLQCNTGLLQQTNPIWIFLKHQKLLKTDMCLQGQKANTVPAPKKSLCDLQSKILAGGSMTKLLKTWNHYCTSFPVFYYSSNKKECLCTLALKLYSACLRKLWSTPP